MELVKEFREFLREYKIGGLAIAFVLGGAATTLIASLVNNVIMPLILPLTGEGNWQTAIWEIGPFKLGWGAFLSSAINFIIIAIVIFLFAKLFLKKEEDSKKIISKNKK